MIGFRNILIPLDRSETAEQAVSVAASIARRSGGTLRLVSVEERLPALAFASDSLEIVQEMEQADRSGAAEYLESIASAVREVQGGKVETTVLEGSAARALSEYADANAVDLIVMTTRGRGALGRWLIGSVTDGMLRRVHVPVLLLHPRDPPWALHFRKLLVALDGEIEDQVLASAVALGSLYPPAHYTIARVVEPPLPVMTPLSPYPVLVEPERLAHLETEARTYVEGVSERLRTGGLESSCEVLVGDVATQLLRVAEATPSDCIVVGTHSRRGLDRLMLGSEAERIVHTAKLPVLIAPIADQ
jgi:nucleotide-binding universal stress UspA family protein